MGTNSTLLRDGWGRKRKKKTVSRQSSFCGATENRTRDTRIFSPLLYQLSYGTRLILNEHFLKQECKYRKNFFPCKSIRTEKYIFSKKIKARIPDVPQKQGIVTETGK